MGLQFSSSNPVLASDDAFNEYYGTTAAPTTRPEAASVQGVVNKTAMFVIVACLTGAVGYTLLGRMPGVLLISCIAAFVISLGVGFAIRGNPKLAAPLGFLYAAVEGIFLGALTAALDGMLEGIVAQEVNGIKTLPAWAEGGLALPAFVITMTSVVAMLGLYSARIIRPTKTFVAVVTTLGVAVGLTYVVAFVMGIFFNAQLPFFSLSSATEGGTSALIGLGISLLFFGVACLFLILDFKRVEDLVDSGAPKSSEWFAAFGLMVTLTWIYYEAVKMAFRLAILFSNRE